MCSQVGTEEALLVLQHVVLGPLQPPVLHVDLLLQGRLAALPLLALDGPPPPLHHRRRRLGSMLAAHVALHGSQC